MCRVGNSVIGNCSSNKKKPVAQGRDGKSTDSIARWIVVVCSRFKVESDNLPF